MRLVVILASYLVTFFFLALTWIRVAGHALPTGTLLVSTGDARLIAWTLAWVAHALGTAPMNVYDAPINYPAAAQLTASEHLFSSQLVFAPVFSASGNALLSAASVALLSYPLAATAMAFLLRRLGCHWAVAWVGGLAFALGPLQVPGNLQVLQYLAAYVPLIALSLTTLRLHTDVRNAAWFAVVLALATFSSYYMAVMVLVTGVTWIAMEARLPHDRGWRFAVVVASITALAITSLALASVPYFARPETGDQSPFGLLASGARFYEMYRDVPGVREITATLFRDQPFRPEMLRDPSFFARVIAIIVQLSPRWFGGVLLMLASAGVIALAVPGSPRRLASRGIGFVLLGFVLALGPLQFLWGHPIRLPFLALTMSPARFFRLPWRFLVLAGFGGVLLAAAALEGAYVRLGRRAGIALTVLVGLALLATRGLDFVGGIEEVPAQTLPIYDVVRRVAETEGRGPLLELPIADAANRSLEWEAMIGGTRHWLPLVTGSSGYPSPHRDRLLQLLALLPADYAFREIVTMTGLRWVLLRPPADWSTSAVRNALLQLSEVEPIVEQDGWVLAKVVDLPPAEVVRH